MPVDWLSEALDQAPDPETGVFCVRLTCSSRHSVNVYMEQPCTSPDGRRVCVMRSAEADPRIPPFDLLAADVYTYRRTWLERECASLFVATSPWSGWVYYVSRDHELKRVNLASLEKEVVWTRWPFPPEFGLASVSSDHRYLLGVQFTNDFTSQLLLVDLREHTSKVILTQREQLSHAQFH